MRGQGWQYARSRRQWASSGGVAFALSGRGGGRLFSSSGCRQVLLYEETMAEDLTHEAQESDVARAEREKRVCR